MPLKFSSQILHARFHDRQFVEPGGISRTSFFSLHRPTLLGPLGEKFDRPSPHHSVDPVDGGHQGLRAGQSGDIFKEIGLAVVDGDQFSEEDAGLLVGKSGSVDGAQELDCCLGYQAGVVGWGDGDGGGALVLRQVGTEGIGAEHHSDLAGQELLGAQLLGGAGSVGGD